MRVKLEDVCERGTSSLMQKDITDKNGPYPVYGASGRIGSMETYQQEHRTVAVVKDGAGIGRTMLLPEKSSIIGTMQYLIPKNCIEPEYLYYVVKYMHLEKYFSGATIPHIYFRDYKTEEFNLHDKTEQREIVSTLKRIEAIISNRQEQLTKLDELIKARFVEMFGDPIANSMGWEKVQLSGCLESIDNGKSYVCDTSCRKGESPAILKLSAVTYGDYRPDENKAMLDEAYFSKDITVQSGDLLFTRKNTPELVGMCAYVYKTPTNLMLPDLIFRLNTKPLCNKIYLWKLINHELFRKQIQALSSGSAKSMSNISKERLLHLSVILPPLSLQNQFAAFVAEVDKSKLFVGSAAAHKPFDIGFFSQKHCATPCKRGIISSNHMIFH